MIRCSNRGIDSTAKMVINIAEGVGFSSEDGQLWGSVQDMSAEV